MLDSVSVLHHVYAWHSLGRRRFHPKPARLRSSQTPWQLRTKCAEASSRTATQKLARSRREN